MRLEEIAQLTVADVQTRDANGGTIVVFNIHNGGKNHLKNETSARAIPVRSELVRAGLLKYGRALPQDGLLFPGLKRRQSKGGKIGARLGELFRRRLIALDMKRDGPRMASRCRCEHDIETPPDAKARRAGPKPQRRWRRHHGREKR